jgi:hypothetical protein
LKELNESFPSETKEKLEISREVIRCFNENDTQGLKNLFCAKTQGLADIDEQMQTGFDLINGSISSFNEEDLLGSEGKSIENGKNNTS